MHPKGIFEKNWEIESTLDNTKNFVAIQANIDRYKSYKDLPSKPIQNFVKSQSQVINLENTTGYKRKKYRIHKTIEQDRIDMARKALSKSIKNFRTTTPKNYLRAGSI